MALTDKLSAIGDAIREKGGTTELLTLTEMPDAIANLPSGGGSDIFPEEGMVFTDDCDNLFQNGKWEWAIDAFGYGMSTKDITTASNMFSGLKKIKRIPFSINFRQATNTTSQTLANLFSDSPLTELPDITGSVGGMGNLLKGCMYVRSIPESWANIDFNGFHSQTYYYYCTIQDFFTNCYSLRTIPEEFVKQLWHSVNTSNGYVGSRYKSCVSLDEIVGVRGVSNTVSTNMFSGSMFEECNRLKRLVFDKENGAPRIEKWQNQTIDLSKNVGHTTSGNKGLITNYNSGITADKEVYDDATYQALKNDADWFTADVAYSRYNHNSAVETINSLPDCSAYLATAGGTNTIKFKGEAGSATDGGAINTMTEEEIAVATAKGWTVSLV